MPKNNNLPPVELPMKIKFGQEPRTEFVNNLMSIHVDLIDYPTIQQLKSYVPSYVNATWEEDPFREYTDEEKEKALEEMFSGRTLPSVKETIGLTFRISGISLQEVTHLIRHRSGSFSADCSGDKWWTDKDALVPFSIQNSPEFYERYKEITKAAKKLYCDMIDSKDISIMDARYILPRNLSTYYYVRFDLANCINFIRQRIDVQIQPETDNIIAYEMFQCLLGAYGHYVADMVDFTNPSPFYQKMARTGKATNLYFPEPEVDTFEYNEKDFIYQCRRKDMRGTQKENENLFEKLQRSFFHVFSSFNVKVPYEKD